MSKILLALGAAALAISAPVSAKPDGAGGNKGGGEHGGGHQSGGHQSGGKHGGGEMRFDHGNGGGEKKFAKAGKSQDRDQFDDARGNDRKGEKVRIVERDQRRDFGRDDGRNFEGDNVRVLARSFGGFGGGRYDNCPPGLARKDNGCLPPGQARKYLGARIEQDYADQLVPYQYRSWYRDDNDYFYRYGDDRIYRVSRSNNLIDGIIPLFGGGYYALGDVWPGDYDFYNVPYQYRDHYGDTSDYRYRYGDGAIYRINTGSGLVDGIVALLAGDLGVGSRLPPGYDTYNVPFSYRDRYADSDDNWYRYNDGYIYQVDPKTRLISAVIDAIV